MGPSDYYHDCLYQLSPGTSSHWPAIDDAYANRAYHNLNHLREMLGHYRGLPANLRPSSTKEGIDAVALFGLALIYHDIIYVAGHSDNEARSADLLEQHLLAAGNKQEEVAFCRKLIMATRAHQLSKVDAYAEALLIDLDLAVLARSETGYYRYAKNVRHEFRRYPGFLYRIGRRKALRHFLAQPYIYQTDYFRKQWEVRARENIRRELMRLV